VTSFLPLCVDKYCMLIGKDAEYDCSGPDIGIFIIIFVTGADQIFLFVRKVIFAVARRDELIARPVRCICLAV